MSVVVRCCVAATLVLGLLLCLVGDAHSSVCCSLPTAVRVPCEHRSADAAAATTPVAEDDSACSSETRSDALEDDGPAAELTIVDVSPDMAADPSSETAADPSSDEGTPSGHVCHEYYCGTVQVEAADTYCSYEPCDAAGCHCAADCIDGSYRTPKLLR